MCTYQYIYVTYLKEMMKRCDKLMLHYKVSEGQRELSSKGESASNLVCVPPQLPVVKLSSSACP